MKCAEATTKLCAYEDGALSRRETRRLREHLEICESCGSEYRAQDALRSGLVGAFSEPLEAPCVIDSVMAQLPERQKPFAWRWAWAAAMVVVVVACGLAVWRQPSRPRVSRVDHPVRRQIEEPRKPVVAIREEAGDGLGASSREPAASLREKPRAVRMVRRPKSGASPDQQESAPRLIIVIGPSRTPPGRASSVVVVSHGDDGQEADRGYQYTERDEKTGITTTCAVERTGESVVIRMESKIDGPPVKGSIDHENEPDA